MNVSLNSQAIVLGRQDYREHDSLVSFYTLKYGRRLLLARGVKKNTSKLAAHIEPFNFVDLMIILGKNRDYVGSAISKDVFLNLKEEINSLYYAGLAFNWAQRLLRDNQTDEQIFYLLLNFLESLNQASDKQLNSKSYHKIIFSWFLFRFLMYLGYQAETRLCLNCQKQIEPKGNYFALALGGTFCLNCYQRKEAKRLLEFKTISDDAIKVLRYILEDDLSMVLKLKISQKLSQELFDLSQSFAEFCLG